MDLLHAGEKPSHDFQKRHKLPHQIIRSHHPLCVLLDHLATHQPTIWPLFKRVPVRRYHLANRSKAFTRVHIISAALVEGSTLASIMASATHTASGRCLHSSMCLIMSVMASHNKRATRRAARRASLPPRRYSWRRATVQSVVRNRDPCCWAPRGPRTMGTSVTGCASRAKTMGAKSKTTVVQVPRRSSNEAGAENGWAGIGVTAPGAVVTVPVRMPVAAS